MSARELECEVVITRSGAPAMLDRATGEVMHPIVGPRIEAERLYLGPSRLAARLAQPRADPLVLFDVGLGAGSNAIAAWQLSEARGDTARRLEIVSFDRSLSALALAYKGEHAAAFGFEGEAGRAAAALLASHEHQTARTHWRVRVGELPEALARERADSVDVVFWDPFSPRANPALWTVHAFHAMRRLCRAGATLHTYSGATAVRSALLLAGFAVGSGEPSSAGKQTTIAALDARDLERPLDRRWLERLGRSSAPLPIDAPEDALARIGALAQFQARESSG